MLIKDILKNIATEEDIRQLVSDAIFDIHKNGAIDPHLLEELTYVKKFYPVLFAEYENELLYTLGLFYKTKEPKSFFETCYKIYSDSIYEEKKERFTPIQADIDSHIKEHKYFSFSAPTSIGKSYLFRYLIQTSINDIVVIVPSRALIAEYLIEITKLVDKSVLVLQFVDNINKTNTKRRVFVVTPERAREIFKYKGTFKIDLFLFDEAQITEEYTRGMLFDTLVRRINNNFPEAKKVFAHPFIENPDAQFIKNNIVDDTDQSVYKQQAVGKIYLATKDEKFIYFSPFEKRCKVESDEDIVLENLKKFNKTLLIYTSKTSIYNDSFRTKFKKYIEVCPRITNPDALNIIHQIEDYVGATKDTPSLMVNMMKRGIVIHHGSIPLYGRMLIENFIKGGYARICFATSTLIQGINMPFDMVWIDNFSFSGTDSDKNVALKNLIGRAGRTSDTKEFDYGYVIIPKCNIRTFVSRITQTASLGTTSLLDENIQNIPEDDRDMVEAIKNDTFNDEYLLPETQLERIERADITEYIHCILDTLFVGEQPLTYRQYNELTTGQKRKLKLAFEKVYTAHLRRDILSVGEKSVLSTSISLLLWMIQGRTFNAILANRYAYITNKDKQRDIEKKYNEGLITKEQMNEELANIELQFSQVASLIPNTKLKSAIPLFTGDNRTKARLKDFKYDMLIFDTYDYIDKVIYFCISTPLSAVFLAYYKKTQDKRAWSMVNYIKYGTNNPCEIWLARYGFSFENIDWIKQHVAHIDENKIVFKQSINKLNEDKRKIIERFI